jgi:hypothetical protein
VNKTKTLFSSVTALFRDYGVAKSTICGIRKKKKHIFKTLKNSFLGVNTQKRIKKAKLPKMEAVWFLKMRRRQLPLSGAMLKAKAKHFNGCIAAFNTCLLWTKQNSNNIQDILVLKKLHECAVRKILRGIYSNSN